MVQKRDAAATREAILKAARAAFTRAGYDGAGVREIAALAGANQALVNRYFGSKEGLFEAAVPAAFDVQPFLAERPDGFAEAIARHLLTKEGDPAGGFDATHAMVRSAGNPRAAALMREGLEARFVGPLAEWLGAPDAEVRAGLFVALLAGLSIMRDVIGLDALQAERTATERWLVALTETLIAGEIDDAPST